MKARPIWLSVLLLGCIAPAAARESVPATELARASIACIPAFHDCGKHRQVLSFPAHAMSFSDSPSFARHPRGVEWLDGYGAMTLTVHRPADYAGGKVKLTVFYQVIDDAFGSLEFTVTPIAFDSGDSFETYGAIGSGDLDISETLTYLFEQSIVIPPGNGWNPDNDWWYLEIGRQGTYINGVRIMSVALEYRAK